MTTDPPRDPVGLVGRGIRATAVAAVVLVVAAAGAVTGGTRRPVLATTAVALTVAAVAHWRHHGRRSGVGASAAVAAGLVAALLVEDVLTDVTAILWLTGLGLVAVGTVLDERRFVTAGLLSLALELARPLPGAPTFRHCLVATDLAVPIPRLTGPLVLAVVAIAVGTGARWLGVRRGAGRGFEATGAVGLGVLLLARAAELPGLRVLCGPGDALDPGWTLVGLAFGAAAVAYGLVGRDSLWAAVGLASFTLQSLLATTLTQSAWWALAAAVPLVAGLLVAERRGIPWPDTPGYGRARPEIGRR